MKPDLLILILAADKATAFAVDPETDDNPARSVQLTAGTIQLEPFAVTVVSW